MAAIVRRFQSGRKGSFNAPAFAQAVRHHGASESEPARPFGAREGKSVVCYQFGLASILALLFASGPTAVAGFVPKVVVGALNSHALGHFSHVGKEVGEFFPANANGDSTGAIEFEGATEWVGASLKHSHPTAVSARARHAVACGLFNFPASTGFCFTGAKPIERDRKFITAITPAKHHAMNHAVVVSFKGSLPDDGEAVKFRAKRHVDSAHPQI